MKKFTQSHADRDTELAAHDQLSREVEDLRAELAGAMATVRHQCEGMSWIAGHDRQGLDHLRESIEATERAEAAEARLRKVDLVLGDHAECEDADPYACTITGDLRDALAAEPAEVTPPAEPIIPERVWHEWHGEVTPPAEQRAEGGA